jgi:predicted secreted protein
MDRQEAGCGRIDRQDLTSVKPGSILAVYLLFWVLSFFLVIPFGVRTDEEAGVERTPGHADSAPHSFSFGRAALRATLVSLVLFGIFYANYVKGWITIDMIDWAAPPERSAR